MKKVSIVGVGKLGYVAGKVMSNFYDVRGYDIAPRIAEEFPMCDTLDECVEGSEFIFIAAQTPHAEKYSGSKPCSHLEPEDFDYTIVSDILKDLATIVTPEQKIVLISTVSPGTVREKLKPLISNEILYNPYLIAQGSIEKDMIYPEMLILGSSDGNGHHELEEFYEPIIKNKEVHYASGTWEECECIKLFYNTFLSLKITFANMAMDIADNFDNVNVDNITGALSKCNQRLFSEQNFTAGMVHGGVCLPRDNVVLTHLLGKLNVGYNLFETITETRELQAKNMAERLMEHNLPVVIVGRSYKPGVPIDQGSPSLLVEHYIGGRQECYFHDPLMNMYAPAIGKAVYLLAHFCEDNTYGLEFPEGSIIVDPWRTSPDIKGCTVIRIGE